VKKVEFQTGLSLIVTLTLNLAFLTFTYVQASPALNSDELIILAFFAYLIALLVTVYFSRERTYTPPVTLSPKQTVKTKKTSTATTKLYRHTLQIPDFNKAQLIINRLKERNIPYTLTGAENDTVTLRYRSPKKANIEKLKKKGIVLDGKIEGEKEETTEIV